VADDDLTGFPALRSVLDAELSLGPEGGVQLSITRGGATYDIAVGENGLGAVMTPQTVVPWTCSSKPIGAIAFARAWDRGQVRPDDLVADYLPEYAANGKESVRVRDLLTHTTGVPDPLMNLDTQGAELPPWDEIEPMIWMVITQTAPVEAPGSSMSYNPISNWFTLDRLLTTVEGSKPGDSYRVTFDLLGISATLGVDATLASADRVGVVAIPEQADNLQRMVVASELPLPGTGVWGTMRDLRSVGEALLACASADNPIVAPSTVEAVTSTHWPGTSRRVLSTTDFDYGMGFMTLPYLFGKACSFRTYGHAGGNNSTLFIDPQADIVIAMYWNRRVSDVGAVTRRIALVDAVYRDLGLSRAS
jgi:CubicO group peptidase (beta-lactamase class C family)